MLYAIVNSEQYQWHLGEIWPLTSAQSENISLIQADGGELEYIKKTFTNLPYSNKRVCIWISDMAKFIACNIMQY